MQLHYMAVSIESFYPKQCIFLTQRKCIWRSTQNNSAYAKQCESSLYFPSIEKVQQKKCENVYAMDFYFQFQFKCRSLYMGERYYY